MATVVTTKTLNTTFSGAGAVTPNGKLVTDGGSPAAIVTVTLGFQPRYVKVQNYTTILQYETYEGMTAGESFLTTGSSGAVTVVTDAIRITSTGFTLAAAIAPASQTMYFTAI